MNVKGNVYYYNTRLLMLKRLEFVWNNNVMKKRT